MAQAAGVTDLGDLPLAVLTATDGADDDWMPMQDDLATLSSNSVHPVLTDVTHDMVVSDKDAARQASAAILAVVRAVRTGTPITAQEG
jgi:hypothetical protein